MTGMQSFAIIPIFMLGMFFLIFGVAAFVIFKSVFGKNSTHRMVNDMLQDAMETAKVENAARRRDTKIRQAKTTADMQCDQCGAACKDGSDISPNGDVKCDYCDCWFNVWD